MTSTYTGILKADAPNRLDGTFPSAWTGFTVRTAEGLIIQVSASTGGIRTHLLAMDGRAVAVEAAESQIGQDLIFGYWETVTPVTPFSVAA